MTERDTTLSALGAYLEQHRGSVSKREASRLAGISEGRWRQIVTGQQKAGGGIVVPANPRRETVIAMARAVNADVDEALRLAGMEPQKSGPEETRRDEASDVEMDDLEEAIVRSESLIDEAKEHMLRQYALLRRVSPRTSSVPRDRQGSHRIGTPSDVEQLRAVARGGDPQDRAEVQRLAKRAREEHEREARGKD